MNKSVFTDCYKIVANSDYFLYIFIGGRGIGKTYSTLKGTLLSGKRIMYVRRTDTEIKNCCDEFTNPYKSLNQDLDRHVEIKSNKDNALIIEKVDDDTTNLYGYATALSTFGKFRGADFSDVDYIVFDEFICTTDINTLKSEATLLFNLIETVNRNRELMDKDSIKVILLSNANTLDNGIIRSLGLADIVQEMKANDQEIWTDDDRGIYLSLLKNAKVKDMKMKTRLYKLTEGTAFFDMAIDNEFTSDYFGDVRKIKYNELTPLVSYENIYFYKHKSKDIILASSRKAECQHYTNQQLKQFKRDYGFLLIYYIDSGQMFYTSYGLKLDVKSIYK